MGRPWRIFFGFYKTRHILLSDSANCIVLRAVVLTQYRRVTVGRTDGIAVASTALAMRRAVKIGVKKSDGAKVPVPAGNSPLTRPRLTPRPLLLLHNANKITNTLLTNIAA